MLVFPPLLPPFRHAPSHSAPILISFLCFLPPRSISRSRSLVPSCPSAAILLLFGSSGACVPQFVAATTLTAIIAQIAAFRSDVILASSA
eukprot:4330856-Prymnesium_polylepis.1